jgi:hypothetical protein
MRALIRLKIQPEERLRELWPKQWKQGDSGFSGKEVSQTHQGEMGRYYEEIAGLLMEVGFAPLKTWHDDLINDQFVATNILHDIPKDIESQEKNHLVMMGYISQGQAHFTVAAINPGELHVRIQAPLFDRLRKACEDFNQKVVAFSRRKLSWSLPGLGREVSAEQYRILVNPVIEVLEAHRDHPTLEGDIIRNPWREVTRENPGELAIVSFTFIISLLLFLFTPDLAPKLAGYFVAINPQFTETYIQGTLERIYSAFFVTFSITLFGLAVRARNLKQFMPIKWGPFNPPRRRR